MNELVFDKADGIVCILSCFGVGAPDMLSEPPVFSWKVYGLNEMQSAYRIIVATDIRKAALGTGDQWDSGWIESNKDFQISYAGNPLKSNFDYYAAIQIKGISGSITPLSEAIRFSTGFMYPADWKASWICSAIAAFENPLFRKRFSLVKPLRRVRLFICGLGYYEAYINGRKVGDCLLAPSWTDYNKRVCYAVHEVTSMLNEENAIGVMLGSGWYSNNWNTPRPTFIAQLMIEYTDGTEESILSRNHDGWYVSNDGPMRKATIYDGEIYDARKEKPGWAEYSYDIHSPASGKWFPVIETEPPAGALVPMIEEPIQAIGELCPISLKFLKNDVAILDFGQNIAGIIRLKMNCPPNTQVRIRYSELLHKDGTLNTDNLLLAKPIDEYTAKGGGEEYVLRFTYHGFRYAEVIGLPNLKIDEIKAVVVRNNVAVRGSLNFTNDLLNKIQKICVWTESNNLHGVPTDCPQRGERLGWLNDLTVRAEEAVYNFDMSRFYRKFLIDISDEQGLKTGAITDTAPYRRYGGQPADAVCSSYLILPWLLYMHYGDNQALERHYNGLASWTGYLENQCEDGIVNYSFYGDWAAPILGNDADSYGAGAVSVITPGRLMSTGFLYLNAKIMSDIARVLGKTSDEGNYNNLMEKTKKALNKIFLNTEHGYYGNNSQAANTFMLYLGIAPEEFRERVVKNLVNNIKEHDTHLTTGNICSRYIFDVLSDNGQIDLAFELATQTTYPSWGYMLANGATTTWERWEFVESGPLLGMASHDHPMYSAISGWFYSYLLGIRPLEPAFSYFQFKPYIPNALEGAEGTIKTIRGDIRASWKQTPQEVDLFITVPFNSTCRIVLPHSGLADVNGVKKEIQHRKDGFFIILPSGQYKIINKRNID